MASGLVFVPAKALAAHPSASASLALLDFVKANKSQLTFYDYQHLVKLGRPAGVILAIVDQYSEVKDQATNQLQPLPPVSEDAADDEELEPIEPTDPSDDEELEEVELPEEQGAQLMEDDSPDEWDNDWGDQWKAGYPDDHDDQIDAKNIPSFDPDLDPEKEWFSDDAVNAWVKADWDECRKGAKPRFYERFDGENIEGPESNEYNPSPLTSSSPLGPHLLIYQVPTQPTKSTDADFLAMFHRYAFLTTNERYRRCSAFKQHDPDLPRWLMVQEFGEQDFMQPECGGLIDAGDLKKRQSEYWWRKNGWQGVRVGIFKIRKGEESKEETT